MRDTKKRVESVLSCERDAVPQAAFCACNPRWSETQTRIRIDKNSDDKNSVYNINMKLNTKQEDM